MSKYCKYVLNNKYSKYTKFGSIRFQATEPLKGHRGEKDSEVNALVLSIRFRCHMLMCKACLLPSTDLMSL